MRKLPTFQIELDLWNKGYSCIAGIDEVGRGSFAGPVVAGAVVFAKETIMDLINKNGIKINDSKKLTAKERKMSSIWIKKNALSWGIGEVGVHIINRIGVGKSAHLAFRRAIKSANERLVETRVIARNEMTKQSLVFNSERQIPDQVLDHVPFLIDYLLIDAFHIPRVVGLPKKRQTPIIKGDSKSISIAAASIIAKVYRDSLIEALGRDEKYRAYEWTRNKGYGTKKHLEAIKKHGICEHHRTQFVETWKRKQKLQIGL